jgi:hypothetical protein
MEVGSVGQTPVVSQSAVAQTVRNDNDADDKGGAGAVAAASKEAPDADNKPSGSALARSSFAVQEAVTNMKPE